MADEGTQFQEPEEGLDNPNAVAASLSADETEELNKKITEQQEQYNLSEFEESPITSSPIIERQYTKGNVNATAEQLNRPIPEPLFEAPPIDLSSPNAQKTSTGQSSTVGGQTSAGGAKKPPEPAMNPSMQEMQGKDKRAAAEHLSTIIIDTYKQVHVVANHSLQISPKKLNRLQAEGTIDMNIPIPYEYGKAAPAGEVLQEYNNQMGSLLEVSPKFVATVKPMLVEVLSKRGAGLTTEQMLVYEFSKHAATNAFIWIQAKRQTKDLIEMIAENTKAVREATEEERARKMASTVIVSPVAAANANVEAVEKTQKETKEKAPVSAGGQQMPNTDTGNFQPTHRQNDRASEVVIQDHSATHPPVVNPIKTEPVKAPKKQVPDTGLNADDIESSFNTIAQENNESIVAASQVLSADNKSKRNRVPPINKFGSGQVGRPTREQRMEKRRAAIVATEKIMEAKKDMSEAGIEAATIEASATVIETRINEDFSNNDIPPLDQVGEDIKDIDL